MYLFFGHLAMIYHLPFGRRHHHTLRADGGGREEGSLGEKIEVEEIVISCLGADE